MERLDEAEQLENLQRAVKLCEKMEKRRIWQREYRKRKRRNICSKRKCEPLTWDYARCNHVLKETGILCDNCGSYGNCIKCAFIEETEKLNNTA